MAAPSHERTCHLDVLAWEALLASAGVARNGYALDPGVVWLVSYRALAAPGTAAHCPNVRAALPADVLAAVLRLAEVPASVTPLAAGASQEAASEAEAGRSWLTTREAARALGCTAHGARAACRRGRLAGTVVDGKWRIDPASLEEYRRSHARADS